MCVSPTRRRRAAALLLVAGGCLWVERGVAQEDPGVEIRTLLRRAERARNAGDLERAESDARRVLGLALEQVGAIDTALGRFGEAERAYVEACRMYPLSPRPCLGVASVSLRIGNYDVGKQWARRVLELDPLHHEARHALGSLYFMEGDFDRAADELRTAYALRPDQTRVAYTLGLVNLERGRLPEAQNLFDEVLEELGDSASLRVFFGRAYRETGHLDLAAEELQAALDLDAQCPGANYYLGLIYLQQRGTGAIPEAVPRFEAERRVNPRHELAGRFLELLGARAEGGDKGGAEVEGRADRPGETFSELLARAASETLILADDPVSDDERRALAALAETYRAAAADANRHLARIRAARRDHGAVGRQEPAARLLDTRRLRFGRFWRWPARPRRSTTRRRRDATCQKRASWRRHRRTCCPPLRR